MKKTATLSILMIFILVICGCGPSKKNYSLSERRQIIDNMANDTLQQLYNQKPSAKQEIDESAGYAVFSNAGVHVIFLGGGGGYGVAIDKTTGRKTYMKATAGGVGFGLGAKDYRQVLIFNTRQTLTDFIGSGWGVGGQADATAKTSTTGGAVGAEDVLGKDITTYTLTEHGLAIQATISGTRYWVDEDLNQPTL